MKQTLSLLLVLAVLVTAVTGCGGSKSAKPTVPPTPPACALSTSLLEFGTVTLGDSLDKTFTLSNTGGGTLFGSLSDTTHQFRLVGGGAYALDGGQSKVFTVRFRPLGRGAAQAAFALSSGSCSPVVCRGSGQVSYPICEVIPSELDFGTLRWGSDFTLPFTVRNAGGGLLWALVTGGHGGFTPDSSASYYVLDPGQSATVNVTYKASFAGSERCTLTVGQDPGAQHVVLTAGGYLDTYGFCSAGASTRDTVNFGTVTVGQSAERSYSITNFSTGYWASGVLFNHSNIFAFTDDFFFNLSPGSSQTGHIRFTPDAPGVWIAAMQISCQEVGSGLTPGVQGYVICKGVAVPGGLARAPLLPESVRRVVRGFGVGVR